ncbi:hypothetical protein NSE_0024 [Neorickettsia sennetsu str. Miyayama]|uniref:Uncharacterized protein n=1 Tax=Ehrlichia sennetsu (strain ATCC VR-367 / Miyayama) TaxID=222891 RepID=Q2GF29_EHRS3|nr:hypothetical protein NSE_0024 [Neorickettsia sennetsu str. Miyayama]
MLDGSSNGALGAGSIAVKSEKVCTYRRKSLTW